MRLKIKSFLQNYCKIFIEVLTFILGLALSSSTENEFWAMIR